MADRKRQRKVLYLNKYVNRKIALTIAKQIIDAMAIDSSCPVLERWANEYWVTVNCTYEQSDNIHSEFKKFKHLYSSLWMK